MRRDWMAEQHWEGHGYREEKKEIALAGLLGSAGQASMGHS